MKPGLWVAVLGVLGVIAGGVIYLFGGHHTIGLGGIGVGVVLLVIGGVMLMKKATPAPM